MGLFSEICGLLFSVISGRIVFWLDKMKIVLEMWFG